MNPSNIIPLSQTLEDDDQDLTQLKNSLEKEPWFDGQPMYFYQGFWAHRLDPIVSCQSNFQAHDTDVVAASFRKVGTTWLKALIFAIRLRANHHHHHHHHPCGASPLLGRNPHELVPHLESNIYAKSKSPDLRTLNSPRLFGTHIPYSSLPSSIKDSNCKIIYISRNPFDTFVSSWLFYQTIESHHNALNNNNNNNHNHDMFDKFFRLFCRGRVPFGPFPDHVLGYRRASLEKPEKVLIVKYEDLKANPVPELKRMAEFMECPFTKEEEVGGVVDDIVKLCSIKTLKEVAESNPSKSDRVYPHIQNDKFFRKGEVGDWINHMTPTMADELGVIMEQQFHGSGFQYM